jgi:hypothetical protein
MVTVPNREEGEKTVADRVDWATALAGRASSAQRRRARVQACIMGLTARERDGPLDFERASATHYSSDEVAESGVTGCATLAVLFVRCVAQATRARSPNECALPRVRLQPPA